MSTPHCRITNMKEALDADDFNRYASAKCYSLLSNVFYGAELAFNENNDGFLVSDHLNQTLDPTMDSHVQILKESLSVEAFNKWKECREHAVHCCFNQMTFNNKKMRKN